MISGIRKVFQSRFPRMSCLFSSLPDPRKKRLYSLAEILTGGLCMFILKEGSRNSINNKRADGYFIDHYRQMFDARLPHQDTISDVLCDIPCEALDRVKMDLMSELFEQKHLRQYRLLDRYYLIAVDATGVFSFTKPHCPHCLTKTSKTGKTTYFHYVLEAKLVTRAGHALSLATEWIENPEGVFDKQDCERKAFFRLAEKLKKQYPRLPVCILADGLYPYEGVFKLCEQNRWKYIFVLQDNSLKSVQEELVLTRRRNPKIEYHQVKDGRLVSSQYRYQTEIAYHGKYKMHWIECNESRRKDPKAGNTGKSKPETGHFEYLTNVEPNEKNVHAIASGGRLRWKVENEGFNTQKHGDYQLQHKFCRRSYNGMQNYYTLLQIAHAINQFIQMGNGVSALLKERAKETLRNLWYKLKAYMIFVKPPPFCIADCDTGLLSPDSS